MTVKWEEAECLSPLGGRTVNPPGVLTDTGCVCVRPTNAVLITVDRSARVSPDLPLSADREDGEDRSEVRGLGAEVPGHLTDPSGSRLRGFAEDWRGTERGQHGVHTPCRGGPADTRAASRTCEDRTASRASPMWDLEPCDHSTPGVEDDGVLRWMTHRVAITTCVSTFCRLVLNISTTMRCIGAN